MRFSQEGGEDAAPVRVLMKADPSSRESLQAEADIDPMDGEQTWPTESELLEAEGAEKTLRRSSLRQDTLQEEDKVLFFASWPNVTSKHIQWKYLIAVAAE